jgi:hypothetical protein
MKTYWRSGGITSHILDLGTRWRWVVSFTRRPLYPQEKNSWYPLGRRLGGPQVLRRIFGPKREEVAVGWKWLRIEELHDLYVSLNTICVIRWRASHVARTWKMKNAYKILVGKPEDRKPHVDRYTDGKIILERIPRKWVGKLRTRCIWLRIGTTGGLLSKR